MINEEITKVFKEYMESVEMETQIGSFDAEDDFFLS